MPLEHLHVDRRRATGFGSMAHRYDRYRSDYPDELIDDLVVEQPSHALDIGCGTGKVAVALARRGVTVLGVDPDPRMTKLVRHSKVTVEVSSFEQWHDHGRQFDLITCGHAWHWVDPALGVDKIAQILSHGGAFARFWNFHAIDPVLLSEFESIYRAHASHLQVIGRDPSGLADADDPFDTHPAFGQTSVQTYRWTRTFTAAEWAGLVTTFGDHMTLPEPQLIALVDGLMKVIEAHGGQVIVRGGTYTLVTRRKPQFPLHQLR